MGYDAGEVFGPGGLKGAFLLIAVALTFCAATASRVSASPLDIHSTQLYLHALVVYRRAQLANVPAVKAADRALERRLSAECPNVLLHAPTTPTNIQRITIELEISAVVAVAEEAVERPAALAFLAKVERLRWSSRRVAVSVKGLAALEHAAESVVSPDLCQDLRSWVNSGYHHIPVTTQHFVEQIGRLGERLGPPFPPPEDRVLAKLKRYEGPKLRALAGREEVLSLRVTAEELLITALGIDEVNSALSVPMPPPPHIPPPPIPPPPIPPLHPPFHPPVHAMKSPRSP